MESFVTVKHKAQLKGPIRRYIELTAWMNDNDANKWSEGLPFVQFAQSTTYHEVIRLSPYEAMLSVKAKRGIASSFLSSEQIANIEIEEQLEQIANTFETGEQLEETDNTSEKI
ncbi:uncharacterized protein TNCV_708961 [Trichonephila clavipes]|nr:uncharacterized protein TNCV_708961 [Trichonephila clavipes]